MEKAFNKIVLIGRQGRSEIRETIANIFQFLIQHNFTVFLDEQTAELTKLENSPCISRTELAKNCDLAIVIGGDGSLLHAAKDAAEQDIPVLGINRGRLGFLTDIHPEEAEKVLAVINGEYTKEQRFLLQATINGETTAALNDVVLLPGAIAQMIEFEIYLDNQFLCSTRADGIIAATPTGSTAYALAAGGPILHSQLDAIVLVPINSHSLTNRPIVIHGKEKIKIIVSDNNACSPHVSCDGATGINVKAGDQIFIEKSSVPLTLIHPLSYDYFETLRSKLYWGKKIS